MINANELLRQVVSIGVNDCNHKKLTDLLCGIKGKFTKKDIQLIRKTIKGELIRVDNVLAKLENEQ